ncbi:MAG: hypothetical protein P4L98_25185 [Ancalomicrobiaceae bacterium]|nr:hypothetical protein [Ancalomicrobiaceae bacterium]
MEQIVGQQIRQAIVSSTPCAGLAYRQGPFHVALDKTREVRLKSLDLCLDHAQSTLQGTVSVACATPDHAAIQVKPIREDFDFRIAFNMASCSVLDLHIEPHGFIGKWVAALADFDTLLRQAAQSRLDSICHKT